MKECENCITAECYSIVDESEVKETLEEIERLFKNENVFDYASSEEMYHYLKRHLDGAYVSDQYVTDNDLGLTYYVIARNRSVYDEYESEVEHQHNFPESYGSKEYKIKEGCHENQRNASC